MSVWQTADRDSQMAESKPVTGRHGESPAAPLGLSLIIHVDCLSACHSLTKNTPPFYCTSFLHPCAASVPPLPFCRLFFLFCAAFFSLSLSLLLSICLSLCCISVPPSRSVFIPLFLCTHWPCSRVQCSYRCVWVGMPVTQWALRIYLMTVWNSSHRETKQKEISYRSPAVTVKLGVNYTYAC